MNAYIDISFLFHVLILITLPYYYKRILNVKFRFIEVLSLIAFSLLLYFNVFVFENNLYLNYISLLFYFMLVYQKKFVKYLFLFYFVYYSNVAITSIFTFDIYLLKGVVFLNTPSSFLFIFIELVNIILIEIIFFSIRSIKLYLNYRMDIDIRVNKDFINVKGYLDSGNTLIIDDLPVIFLKEEYFNDYGYKEMIVKGIGYNKCKYFVTEVIFNNNKRKVICASSKNGFKGCDCLININLLEDHIDEITK